MTLEARVRTVDAMELVDLRSSRAAANSLFFSVPSWLRRFRITNHQIRKRRIAIAATPPTTPPAMAPTLVPPPESLGADELLPFSIHLVSEQVSQVWLVIVQI